MTDVIIPVNESISGNVGTDDLIPVVESGTAIGTKQWGDMVDWVLGRLRGGNQINVSSVSNNRVTISVDGNYLAWSQITPVTGGTAAFRAGEATNWASSLRNQTFRDRSTSYDDTQVNANAIPNNRICWGYGSGDSAQSTLQWRLFVKVPTPTGHEYVQIAGFRGNLNTDRDGFSGSAIRALAGDTTFAAGGAQVLITPDNLISGREGAIYTFTLDDAAEGDALILTLDGGDQSGTVSLDAYDSGAWVSGETELIDDHVVLRFTRTGTNYRISTTSGVLVYLNYLTWVQAPEGGAVDAALTAQQIGEGLIPGDPWAGNWDSSITYHAGRIVRYQGSIWISVVFSGVGTEPGTSNHWVLISNEADRYRGRWSNANSYSEGDIVLGSTTFFIARQNILVGSGGPASNPTLWDPITDYQGTFRSDGWYTEGSIVKVAPAGGSRRLYVANEHISPADGDPTPNPGDNNKWIPMTPEQWAVDGNTDIIPTAKLPDSVISTVTLTRVTHTNSISIEADPGSSLVSLPAATTSSIGLMTAAQASKLAGVSRFRETLTYGTGAPAYSVGDWGIANGVVVVCVQDTAAGEPFHATRWRRLDNEDVRWTDILNRPTIPTAPATWAETGNTDTIPAAKIPASTAAAPATWAQAGNTDLIPESKIPAHAHELHEMGPYSFSSTNAANWRALDMSTSIGTERFNFNDIGAGNMFAVEYHGTGEYRTPVQLLWQVWPDLTDLTAAAVGSHATTTSRDEAFQIRWNHWSNTVGFENETARIARVGVSQNIVIYTTRTHGTLRFWVFR